MLGEPCFDLCLKQSKQAFTILNCWFARDVTVAMLVVKNKSIPPLGTKLCFHVNSSRKETLLFRPPTWPPCHVVTN